MGSDQIERVIEQIRLLPNVQVDCGVAQGQNRFFAHLLNHSSTPERLELPFDWHVKETDKCLKQVDDLVQPFSLPTDYLSFLKLYGGITISNEDSWFTSLGLGPMSEEWYPYLAGKVGYYQHGFLKIGALRFCNPIEDKFMYVSFFLDLGNRIQRNGVIGVSMWELGALHLQDVFREPQSHSFCWSLIADSFTAWFQIVATTQGRFKYL
jgi:hypothetical protein